MKEKDLQGCNGELVRCKCNTGVFNKGYTFTLNSKSAKLFNGRHYVFPYPYNPNVAKQPYVYLKDLEVIPITELAKKELQQIKNEIYSTTKNP